MNHVSSFVMSTPHLPFPRHHRLGASLLLTAVLTATTASGLVVNFNNTATGFGLLPDTSPLFQGTAAGIADGGLYDWTASGPGATSPREDLLSNLQPWMTWTSDQPVRTVRIWSDVSVIYDRLRVDVLGGTLDPTVEGNWSNVYDTGTGLGQRFADLDLGSTYTTRGLRVRADRTGTDINVGEVAVFGPLAIGGALTGNRVFPTSVGASSSEYGAAAGANDGDWYTRWQTRPAVNPDPDFSYDLFFSSANLDAVSLTFSQQGGYAAIPTSWELLVDTGSGLTSLGPFSPTTAQNGVTDGMYYINLGSLTGVNQLRFRASEASLGGNGIGLMEFEAFLTQVQVPEPGTLGLLAIGIVLLGWRRRL